MTTSDQPIEEPSAAHMSNAGNSRSDLEQNVTSRATWLRLAFMLIFGFLYMLSRIVTLVVVVIQFFHVLLTGTSNRDLKDFGHSLAIYSYQVVDYLTFNTEAKPFPLESPWPTTMTDT